MNAAIYPMTLYYESACPLCKAEMTNLMLRDRKGLLRFEDVSAPGFSDPPPGTTAHELLELIHARTADGAVIRGVEVFRLAYRAVGLGWLVAPTRWPLLRLVCDCVYPIVARNRHRFPPFLVHVLFETAVRRAAEKGAGAARCTPETCKI
jgi:predicted DCC family thiol-disulfide oxidoreductase YuxK